MMEKMTMTRSELAARVGLSVRKVDDLLRDGDVSCVRIGARVPFTDEHARALFAKFESRAAMRGSRPAAKRA